ncbi:MAG: hypothetical protein D4R97_01370 [Bacteroidetes bacterium]|nr:MAG: hypothetical protein D4R97_01370 [Bacteroidota bacterium]
MRKVIIFIIYLLLVNCSKQENFLFYQKYNNDLKQIKGEIYLFRYTKINQEERLLEILKQNRIVFKMKIKEDSIGLYYFCDNKYSLTHPFNETNKSEDFCRQVYPFFHRLSKIVKSKLYEINNDQFKVICYSEMSNSAESNITYYLKGFGFICFYDFFSGDMYLCNEVENSPIKSEVVRGITNMLINDTTFFVKYRKQTVPETINKFLPPDGSYK